MSEIRKKIATKNAPSYGQTQCNKEFTEMKRSLLEAPCHSFSIFTYNSEEAGPFIMTTDYSTVGMSAILSQVQQGEENLLACTGRKSTNPESAYSSIKG